MGQARPADPHRDELDQRGVDQDRHQRRGERRVVDVGADMPRLPSHLDQDEGELPDLSEPDAHQDRGPQRLAEDESHSGPDRELADDDEPDQGPEQRQVRGDRSQIDEGADGDEEERDERVPKREEARERLMGVVRLVDEEARQERPERER